MQFSETRLPGVYVIELEKIRDDRGYFARCWCKEEFAAEGLKVGMVQMNAGLSYRRGTLRGMHFQLPPYGEVKLIRCDRGAIYDVIIDLRPDSPTYCQWFAAELSEDNGSMIYAPEGCAHGYQTLVDNSQMSYMTTQVYQRDYARGVRFDDPAFGIRWPLEATVISLNDRNWPDFVAAETERLRR
jgi:dTDP-4-dehydrorhamnose 3,5-epimerase